MPLEITENGKVLGHLAQYGGTYLNRKTGFLVTYGGDHNPNVFMSGDTKEFVSNTVRGLLNVVGSSLSMEVWFSEEDLVQELFVSAGIIEPPAAHTRSNTYTVTRINPRNFID